MAEEMQLQAKAKIHPYGESVKYLTLTTLDTIKENPSGALKNKIYGNDHTYLSISEHHLITGASPSQVNGNVESEPINFKQVEKLRWLDLATTLSGILDVTEEALTGASHRQIYYKDNRCLSICKNPLITGASLNQDYKTVQAESNKFIGKKLKQDENLRYLDLATRKPGILKKIFNICLNNLL